MYKCHHIVCVYVCVCTVNLPKPPQLLARLLVMAGHPSNGQSRGEHVLACLRTLGPNIKDDVVSLWDNVIPKLQSYINEETEKWDQKHWEDLMLKVTMVTNI